MVAVLAFFAYSPTPATVPAHMLQASWVLPVSVDGKPGLFTLDTTNENSSVESSFVGKSKFFLGKGDHTVQIGGLQIDHLPMTECQLPGQLKNPDSGEEIVGNLGRDVLSKYAIGLDMLSERWTFWPGGRVGDKAATDWVKAASLWPGLPPVSETQTLAVSDTPDGPSISICLNGNRLPAVISLGLDQAYVPAGVVPRTTYRLHAEGVRLRIPGVEVPMVERCAPNYQIGATTSWLTFTSNSVRLPKGKEGAINLSPFDLRSPRFLLDLPAKRVYLEKPPEEVALSMVLTEMTGVAVTAAGSKLVMGPYRVRTAGRQVRQFDGDQVSGINDIEVQDLLEDVRRQKSTALEAFLTSIQTTFTIDIDTKDGTVQLELSRRE